MIDSGIFRVVTVRVCGLIGQDRRSRIVTRKSKVTSTLYSATGRLLGRRKTVKVGTHLSRRPRRIFRELIHCVGGRRVASSVLLLISVNDLAAFTKRLRGLFPLGTGSVPLIDAVRILRTDEGTVVNYNLHRICIRALGMGSCVTVCRCEGRIRRLRV